MKIYGITHRWWPGDNEVEDEVSEHFYFDKTAAETEVEKLRQGIVARQAAEWTRKETQFQTEKARRLVLIAANLEKPNSYYDKEHHAAPPAADFRWEDYEVSEHEVV